MKKRNIMKMGVLILMLVVVCSSFAGCRRPYDKPEFITIEPSQTAFLVPLVGDSSSQASFESHTVGFRPVEGIGRVNIDLVLH